jgi:serine/threonine-protein kinase
VLVPPLQRAPRVTALRAAPGQVLDGRFRLTEELARGGMSTVFKAEDLRDGGRPVVVKVPLPIFSAGAGGWSLFQREEQIGLQLDHPFVLKFLPPAPGERRPYVVTEFLSGRTLESYIDARAPLPEGEALSIAGRLCDALEHLHARGIVHYDVKPANVMLCADGSIRIIDFGLAHDLVTGRFTLAGPPPAIGSSGYVAPEQIRRKRGRRSVDIYGLGAILYEMLTGRAPFPGDDPFVIASARTLGDPPAPRLLNPRLSREAEEITLRALRRDPAERYPSAAAMKAELDEPSRVVVTGLADRLRPVTAWARRRRLWRYIAVVCVLPVLTQVALFVLLWRHFRHRP